MNPAPIRRRLALLAVLPLLAAGCMIEPFEGQYYPSRSTPIDFNGYVDTPQAPVRIYAQTWNDRASCGSGSGAWTLIGSATSSIHPLHDANGMAWYGWHFTGTVPASGWCLAPGPEPGGLSYSTNVTATYRYHASQLGTKWRTMYTSHAGTPGCAVSDPSKSGLTIIGNCSRIAESDWYAVQIWAE